MRKSFADTRRSLAILRNFISSAASISWEAGRFSEAPYAIHRVGSIVAGGEARKVFELERERGGRAGVFTPFLDVGGGVISDEDAAPREEATNSLPDAVEWRSISGVEAEDNDVARGTVGVLGITISAGGSRKAWEFCLVSPMVTTRDNAVVAK